MGKGSESPLHSGTRNPNMVAAKVLKVVVTLRWLWAEIQKPEQLAIVFLGHRYQHLLYHRLP